jgi:ABC-2 type transport system permease protein
LVVRLINVWRQKPGKRADFRRRRSASWFATLAEILIAMLLAGATSLTVAGLLGWGLLPLIVAGALKTARSVERDRAASD